MVVINVRRSFPLFLTPMLISSSTEAILPESRGETSHGMPFMRLYPFSTVEFR